MSLSVAVLMSLALSVTVVPVLAGGCPAAGARILDAEPREIRTLTASTDGC